MYLLATKLTAKWSKASGESSGGLRVENRAEVGFFFKVFKIVQFFSQFIPVPFCELVRIWSSFLSILLCSNYLQYNFEVPGPLRSISLGLIPTVLYVRVVGQSENMEV